MEAPQKVYTVSELTAEIKELIEGSFEYVWVEGEASNVHLHSSGHLYLTLKDERCQIRAVMFRNQARLLAFEPEHGMFVLCRGRLGVYEVRGEYQLYLDFMEPRGLGALQKAFEQLRDRLQKEGLFDSDRKQPLPCLPRCIGIVTSPTGAAIRDILQILDRRFPNLHILIRPTRVQGEGAANDVADAVDDLNLMPDLDLIVLARGGGSLEDLWAFNEEIVARAIARSRLPVVSGVGHEVDFTIADFVADLRAPTPSAAAELIVPQKQDLKDDLCRITNSLSNGVMRVIRQRRETVAQWFNRIPDPRRKMADQRLLLDDFQGRLMTHFDKALAVKRQVLANQCERILSCDLRKRTTPKREELSGLMERIARGVGIILRDRQDALNRHSALLQSLSPLNVLGRGYSVTRKLPTGEIVCQAEKLTPGDRVRVIFHRGEATCAVEETEETRKDLGKQI
jgi:exodeoxyribonuclease VII large subunit